MRCKAAAAAVKRSRNEIDFQPVVNLIIECDLHFEAHKPISAYIEEANRLGRINA